MKHIYFSTSAAQTLKDLCDKAVLERLRNKIAEIRDHPELGKTLRGDWTGHRSVRIGQWRVIYRPDPERHAVVVVYIGRRRAGERRDPYRQH